MTCQQGYYPDDELCKPCLYKGYEEQYNKITGESKECLKGYYLNGEKKNKKYIVHKKIIVMNVWQQQINVIYDSI